MGSSLMRRAAAKQYLPAIIDLTSITAARHEQYVPFANYNKTSDQGIVELYQSFLSALQVNGYSAIPSGSVIKIVPDSADKGFNSAIYNENVESAQNAMTVFVVAIKFVPATELVAALNQFLTPSGRIVA